MTDASDRIKRMERLMDDALKGNPHTENIINAFRPVLVTRTTIMSGLDFMDSQTFILDDYQFRSGVAILQQNGLPDVGDVFRSTALSLIPAIIQGFEALRSDMEKLEALIKAGSIDLSRFFQASPADAGELSGKWSGEHGVSPQAMGFLTRMTARTVLGRMGEKWSGRDKVPTWDKGYCPICGSPPMVARVMEGITTRWLHCSTCGHAWVFSRVICPACDNKEQKDMNYFFVEEKDREKAFVCENCKQYLITVDKVNEHSGFDADVAALSLVHLDIIMQEKGYRPMAECEWNIFT
jgi:FdhE protein